MKTLLIALFATLSTTTALADTHVCTGVRSREGDPIRVTFKFNQGRNADQVLVTIFRKNRIQLSHLTKQYVDSDSSGDGWSMSLRDSAHRQYRYALIFDAANLHYAYVTMPGLVDARFEFCRRIRN